MKSAPNSLEVRLLSRLKESDPTAMVSVYDLYWKRLYVSAFNILKDQDACEDIIQELFIRIWKNRDKLNIQSSFEHYLQNAVRYDVYRVIRENKRFGPIAEELADSIPSGPVTLSIENKEIQQQIDALVDALPPKCRLVFQLSRKEMLTHREIAMKLAISTKTVRNHITHALQHIRLNMNEISFLIITLSWLTR